MLKLKGIVQNRGVINGLEFYNCFQLIVAL